MPVCFPETHKIAASATPKKGPCTAAALYMSLCFRWNDRTHVPLKLYMSLAIESKPDREPATMLTCCAVPTPATPPWVFSIEPYLTGNVKGAGKNFAAKADIWIGSRFLPNVLSPRKILAFCRARGCLLGGFVVYWGKRVAGGFMNYFQNPPFYPPVFRI